MIIIITLTTRNTYLPQESKISETLRRTHAESRSLAARGRSRPAAESLEERELISPLLFPGSETLWFSKARSSNVLGAACFSKNKLGSIGGRRTREESRSPASRGPLRAAPKSIQSGEAIQQSLQHIADVYFSTDMKRAGSQSLGALRRFGTRGPRPGAIHKERLVEYC